MPLGIERLLGRRLLALPLVDQHVQPQLLAPEQIEIARQVLIFTDDSLAHAHEFGEIAGKRVGLHPHIRKHSAKRNRRAHGLQGVFRLHQECRRRLMPYPLQHGEDFDDHGAALVERLTNETFLFVERL